MRVIGYTRVSTEEQAESGNGLAAQEFTITEHAERRGWDVEWMTDEGRTGSVVNLGLRSALDLLRTQQADALVVAKVDRLARSLLHSAEIMDAAKRQGWALIVCDLGLDTATPQGRAFVQQMAVWAELEREMISIRTKEGLARAKANGVRLGRPSGIATDVRRRIVKAREAGLSFATIASGLTGDGILTPTGRNRWDESVVRRAYAATTA